MSAGQVPLRGQPEFVLHCEEPVGRTTTDLQDWGIIKAWWPRSQVTKIPERGVAQRRTMDGANYTGSRSYLLKCFIWHGYVCRPCFQLALLSVNLCVFSTSWRRCHFVASGTAFDFRGGCGCFRRCMSSCKDGFVLSLCAWLRAFWGLPCHLIAFFIPEVHLRPTAYCSGSPA